jgi:hypothetical protein
MRRNKKLATFDSSRFLKIAREKPKTKNQNQKPKPNSKKVYAGRKKPRIIKKNSRKQCAPLKT